MLTRRTLLELLVASAAFGGSALAVKSSGANRSRLRPPGALDEDAFLAQCIRCYRCAEVCPPQCIVFDSTLPAREADTPFIIARDAGCTMCMQCGPACPTGALTNIERTEVRMGVPVLDTSACFAHNGSRPCRVCHDVCPLQGRAVALEGTPDGRLVPRFHVTACTGCGLCEEACPSSVGVAGRAIHIKPARFA